MNKSKVFFSLPVVIALVSTAPITRADSNNFYVLGSIGRSNITTDNSSIDALNIRDGFLASSTTDNTTNDTGYKAQLGYRYGNFAIEGGYTDLGRSSFTSTTTNAANNTQYFYGDASTKLINLDVVGYAPLGKNFSLLGRLGVYNWETDSNVPMPSGELSEITDRGWNVKFGGGLQYDFNDYFGLRAEFERYNGVGNSDTTGNRKVNLMSAGAVIKF